MNLFHINFICLPLLLAVAVGCGDGSGLDFRNCEAIPPPQGEYGTPDGQVLEPESPPHTSVQYRWNCVAADVLYTDGEVPPNNAHAFFVQEEWASDGECWILISENRSPDNACPVLVAEQPDP